MAAFPSGASAEITAIAKAGFVVVGVAKLYDGPPLGGPPVEEEVEVEVEPDAPAGLTADAAGLTAAAGTLQWWAPVAGTRGGPGCRTGGSPLCGRAKCAWRMFTAPPFFCHPPTRYNYGVNDFLAWRAIVVPGGVLAARLKKGVTKSSVPVAPKVMAAWDSSVQRRLVRWPPAVEIAALGTSQVFKSVLLDNLLVYPASALGQFFRTEPGRQETPWCSGFIVSKGNSKVGAKVITAAHWCARVWDPAHLLVHVAGGACGPTFTHRLLSTSNDARTIT
jgi:hypothetical protein